MSVDSLYKTYRALIVLTQKFKNRSKQFNVDKTNFTILSYLFYS